MFPFLLQYDSSSISKIGGGGEYDVQVGFGWSNGVVLDFLDMYGDRLRSKEENELDATGCDGAEDDAQESDNDVQFEEREP